MVKKKMVLKSNPNQTKKYSVHGPWEGNTCMYTFQNHNKYSFLKFVKGCELQSPVWTHKVQHAHLLHYQHNLNVMGII